MRIAEGLNSRFGLPGWKAVWAASLVVCAMVPWLTPQQSGTRHTAQPGAEWPQARGGLPLRPLALGAVEQRFAAQFPGQIARLTDGQQLLVWRRVNHATRMLHPATDCYRGLGYRIEQARLERNPQGVLSRCFVAERAGQRLRVCEHIEGADGQSFTDTSSWFWAAQLGQSTGPWQAFTEVRPL